MKLTTVVGSVNLNPQYYMFIPKQIAFWNHFHIRFVAILVGDHIPEELLEYVDNIILWNKNPHLNTVFVGQNLRIYYPALFDLPDDELIMITDMDMLPMSQEYFTNGLEEFQKDDFICYREIYGSEIAMCYNAAHPHTWGKIFNIKTQDDIEERINKTYNVGYSGIPGKSGWNIDQLIMYKILTKYPHFKILKRPIRRLEMWKFQDYINRRLDNFIGNYDDAHFHRSYFKNEKFIMNTEQQLLSKL
jgi:hypothetical protein